MFHDSYINLVLVYYYIQVQKSFNMDVGKHHAKNLGNKEIPLAILSRILAQSCLTLCLSVLFVLVYLIVLLRELLVSTIFCMMHTSSIFDFAHVNATPCLI